MYLPQFHRVQENDEWWGEGFTDWVSVKNAKRLFEGHYQPHIPIDENYYDLINKDTMKWQAYLMKQYGIDGQCIYHYWFKDGRKILEKPAENLLEWTDIDMPFCFCWANETWARSWSNIKKSNVWSSVDEPDYDIGNSGVLLEQNYGKYEQWKQHFEYLLPFFKDRRYIKIEGKPIFLIYRSSEIYCLEEMVDCFNQLALLNNLPGVYFICANVTENLPQNVNAILIHEPQNSLKTLVNNRVLNEVNVVDYNQCWDISLKSFVKERKTYYEGFVSYDDTPRRGINGTIIYGSNPDTFTEKLAILLSKSEKQKNEVVFLNAWNEWGEGMHLEPDLEWGYKYLEGVRKAKDIYKEIIYEIESEQSNITEMDLVRHQKNKFENYLNILDLWFLLREKNISLVSFFEESNYTKIGIYGYGIFARHLIYELDNTSVKIVALIDKQRDKISCELYKVLPGEEPDDLDVIIVTSYFYYEEIRRTYKNSKIKILSIENIIKEVANINGL